ncbi:MAG: hypothetical protein Q4E67_05875 [Planctomycetia bacterium]|nr:hypothetical protein [Planctomycetia bacterium]
MSRIVWCNLLLWVMMGMSNSFLGAKWTTEVIQKEDTASAILKVGQNDTIGGAGTEPRANLTLYAGGKFPLLRMPCCENPCFHSHFFLSGDWKWGLSIR